MRELNVYYCSKCGHYGFYQTSQKAICAACENMMNLLPMCYKSFMNMEYSMRDKIIANQLAGDLIPSCSVVQRITALENGCDDRIITIQLKTRIEELEANNEALRQKNLEQENTITWMHSMIWDLAARLKHKE